AEDGIRDFHVTGVQTCALPISPCTAPRRWAATASSCAASSIPRYATRWPYVYSRNSVIIWTYKEGLAVAGLDPAAPAAGIGPSPPRSSRHSLSGVPTPREFQ